jgi:hypothetical protein
MTERLKSDFFLNSINQLSFGMEMWFVSNEGGTEI